MTTLFHYTCDHALPLIERDGILRPSRDGMLWLTDLDTPSRDALGLTMHFITCDRTAYRFRVTEQPSAVQRWVTVRRALPRDYVETLEAAPGAMPMHWWVSPVPVRAERSDWR